MSDIDSQIADMLQALKALNPQRGSHETSVPDFYTHRHECEMPLTCSCGELACSLILSGSKSSLICNREIIYHSGEGLLSGAALPSAYRALNASPEHPFYSISLRLDRALLIELAENMTAADAQPQPTQACFIFTPWKDLLEDFSRLIHLAANPNQVKVRAPLVIRDLHYLLLTGATAPRLLPLLRDAAPAGAIVRAVSWLRANFATSIAIEELARMHNMSTSNFHRQFKGLTGMSPLQFQKQIRLFEAQRMMLAQHAQVAEAAYAVGYESPTQFVREYKRQFGDSPLRDVRRRRTAFAAADRYGMEADEAARRPPGLLLELRPPFFA